MITVHSAQRGGKIRKSELYSIFRLNLCYKILFLYRHLLYAVKRFKNDQCLCKGLRTCQCVKLFLFPRHSLVVPTHNYTEIVYGANLDKKNITCLLHALLKDFFLVNSSLIAVDHKFGNLH